MDNFWLSSFCSQNEIQLTLQINVESIKYINFFLFPLHFNLLISFLLFSLLSMFLFSLLFLSYSLFVNSFISFLNISIFLQMSLFLFLYLSFFLTYFYNFLFFFRFSFCYFRHFSLFVFFLHFSFFSYFHSIFPFYICLFSSFLCFSFSYIKKLATIVEGDQLLHWGVGQGATQFHGWLHFTLYPYLIMLSVKPEGIKYHFLSLWYDSTWDWSPGHWRTVIKCVVPKIMTL